MSQTASRRRPDIVLIVSFLALAAIGVLLVRATRRPAEDFTGRDSLVAVSNETTFRNVTRADISYTVRHGGSAGPSETRTLRPGAVDRFPAGQGLEVIYPSGDKQLFFVPASGMPYSFRYNEKGRVQIYPGSHGRSDAADLAPYVPTPMPVVARMLAMAGVSASDVVYDIGCGDGRVVVEAAARYKARGVGIDILARLVEEASARARLAGVQNLTRFLCLDAMKADISEATVVAIYLLPESNALLRPKLERELSPGTRVVTHGYPIDGWEGLLTGKATVSDELGRKHSVYAYRLPAGGKGRAAV